MSSYRLWIMGFLLGMLWMTLDVSDAAAVGSLRVSLAPHEAVAGGAQWRRVGTGTWFDSGATEDNLDAGTYNVEFKAVEGWATPAGRSVAISDGQTTAFTLEYAAVQSGIAWSTYLGQGIEYGLLGGGNIQGSRETRSAVDKDGNILVIGSTSSSGWVSGGYDPDYAGSTDAFVAKLSPAGEHLWSTYLGGSGYDYGLGIATDDQGNVYAVGDTSSTGWISGGYAPSYRGGSWDGFLVQLSPQGEHLWSTYIGGNNYDSCHAVAVQSSGYVYVTGVTSSVGWTSNGGDTTQNGDFDAFIVKVTTAGAHVWSSYYGGSISDAGTGICLDSTGQCYICGTTCSSGWIYSGYDTSYNGGVDGFLLKVTGSSGGVLWGTYLGGANAEWASDVAIDSSNNLYVVGQTDSSGWISGGFDTTYHGSTDAFVVKMTPMGLRLWSTYLGGASGDWGHGVAVDGNGNVCVCGTTNSAGWTRGGYQTTISNYSQEAFVAQLSPAGQHLWSTYLGGNSMDTGDGVVVDGQNNIIATGLSASKGWVAGGFDTSFNGTGTNAFVAKLHVFTSLRIDIDPPEAVAQGAQWRRVGTGTWLDSGAVEQLAVGSYTVEFKTIENWTAPIQKTVTVKDGQASAGSGTYVIIPGMLGVTITPPEAAAHGAKWRRVGTTTWRDSQTTETNLPNGTYTVEFTNLDLVGWTSPSPASVQVAAGTRTNLTIGYAAQPITVKLDSGAPNHISTPFNVGIWFSRPAIGLNTGNLATTNATVANLLPLTTQPSLACGAYHSLAIGADGQASAWGYNLRGQTTLPAGLGAVVAMAAVESYNLVLKADGTLVIWGGDSGSPKASGIPTGLPNVVSIAAGYNSCLALRGDGMVVAWGGNFSGECNIPANLARVAAISANGAHSLALRSDGTVVGWGNNYDGQCDVPAGLKDVVAIASGARHNMALRADGTVAAWGNNDFGQCDVPAGLKNVIAITSGYYHNLALRSDGTVVAWGNNGAGACNVPANLVHVVAIAAGNGHNLALRDDGSVVAWGSNYYGQCTVPAGLTVRQPAMTLGRFDVTPLSGGALAVIAPAGTAASVGGVPTQTSNLLTRNSAASGSLKVTVQPAEAATLGGKWRLAGTTAWQASGATSSDVAPGEALVEFSDINGWTTPAAQFVAIKSNVQTVTSGTYMCVSGSLGVSISPASAIAAGAQWRRVGTTVWRNSGTTETAIPMGKYDIEFKDVAGWSTPLNQHVTIPAHGSIHGTGVYTVLTTGVTWSTYLGGTGDDQSYGVAFDHAGNMLVSGTTTTDGWTVNGRDTSQNGGQDVFLAKIAPSGALLWSTYIGGNSDDRGGDVVVDRDDNIYVAGSTYSAGWVSGGYQTTFNTSFEGSTDGFLVKLSPGGQHLWSTYIGGTTWDYASAVAVDSQNNVYVAGLTESAGWTRNGYDTSFNAGYEDGYLIKLSAQGAHLWSTYIGGSSYDRASAVAVDGSDNVVVTGSTQAYGLFEGTPPPDAYVMKFSATGACIWYDELGGSNYDTGNGVACDAAGNVFVAGTTSSPGWISGGYNTTNQSSDGFLVKYSPQGSRLWGTYLGGSGTDAANGVAVDAAGNVYVVGDTLSSGWFGGGINPVHLMNCYILKLTNGGQPVWGSYIGGANNYSQAVAVDEWGDIGAAGYTFASQWAEGGYDTQYDGGTGDGFAIRIHGLSLLKVTLGPAEAVKAGACWRRKGTTAWLSSDAVDAQAPTGPCEIEFKPVSGWDAPGNLTVNIAPQAQAKAAATYKVHQTPVLPGHWTEYR